MTTRTDPFHFLYTDPSEEDDMTSESVTFPDPPEAPVYLDSDGAFAWQCGWSAGAATRAEAPEEIKSDAPWAIDAEGRIFHEGRFVALIERTPHRDGTSSTGFLMRGVSVDGPDERMRWSNKPFESSVGGTTAMRISEDEWETLNATAQAAAESR